MLTKVISGGQTGADTIGLEAASAKGIPTGGTAPKGWRTEKGSNPDLKKFGLEESPFSDYGHRTTLNVMNSDGTVLFGDMISPGSLSTIKICKRMGKPYIDNPTYYELVDWVKKNNISILNVAGNRGSKLDSTDKITISNTLTMAFSMLGH